MESIYEKFANELNKTTTDNGDVAFKTTLNSNLDLFGTMGSMRGMDEPTIKETFLKAYKENELLAMANLLYLRDIRSGMGERRTFNLMLKELIKKSKEQALSLADTIVELGRWDDLFLFEDDNEAYAYVVSIIKKQLTQDADSE